MIDWVRYADEVHDGKHKSEILLSNLSSQMFNPRFLLNLLYWLSTNSLVLLSNRAFNSNMNWFRIHSKLWLGHTNDESSPKLKTDTNDIQDPLFIWISFTHVFFCLEIYWKWKLFCGRVSKMFYFLQVLSQMFSHNRRWCSDWQEIIWRKNWQWRSNSLGVCWTILLQLKGWRSVSKDWLSIIDVLLIKLIILSCASNTIFTIWKYWIKLILQNYALD